MSNLFETLSHNDFMMLGSTTHLQVVVVASRRPFCVGNDTFLRVLRRQFRPLTAVLWRGPRVKRVKRDSRPNTFDNALDAFGIHETILNGEACCAEPEPRFNHAPIEAGCADD